jgi:hypothetical protein
MKRSRCAANLSLSMLLNKGVRFNQTINLRVYGLEEAAVVRRHRDGVLRID